MNGAAPMRNRGWIARVCGFVTVLTLVVAPMCAPLCAAQICAQGPASAATEAPCHLMAATGVNIPQVHAVQNCGASELPAATVTSLNKNDALQIYRSAAFLGGPDVLSGELPSLLAQHRDRCFVEPHSSYLHSSLAMGVLRI